MSASEKLGRQWSWGVSPIGDPTQMTINRRIMTNSLHGSSLSGLDWDTVPEQHFHPHELRPTQHDFEQEKHAVVRADPSHVERPVHVVKAFGNHYVYDGHHRWDLAQEQGRPVRARVFDADKHGVYGRR